MSRYIDADMIEYFKTFNPNKGEKTIADMAWRSDIDAIPTADVVSKEKYDELNDRYHRLLESANILVDTVREYERREDAN